MAASHISNMAASYNDNEVDGLVKLCHGLYFAYVMTVFEAYDSVFLQWLGIALIIEGIGRLKRMWSFCKFHFPSI